MADEVLVKVESLSKKFCKDLKTSLWYGVKDLFFRFQNDEKDGQLRPKEFWAVKDVSFELRRGECLGLIGHNGAGKSTLLKILNGLINPDEGQVTMNGRVGALIELGAGFNPILTGRENIYNNAAILGFTRKEIDDKIHEIIEFSEIEDFIDMPVQNYSSGMKVRLGFSIAAQMKPDILIIDEVLAVGDVAFRLKCLNKISKLLDSSAVIFVSHSMPQIFRIANEVLVMSSGKAICKTNDIGLGIDQYYGLVKKSKISVSGGQNVSLLKFTGETVEASANFGETLDLSHGQDIRFTLTFQKHIDIDSLHLQIIIWNPELVPVIDIIGNGGKGYILDCSENSNPEVEVNIPNLYLNTGKHAVTLIVYSGDMMTPYLRVDNALTISVKSHFPSGSNIIFPAKWKTL